MSHALSDVSTSSSPLQLRTADQYEAWVAKISDKCWSKTGKDIFTITDAACVAALTKLHSESKSSTESAQHGWVTTCWSAITKSLHDEIMIKVAHVERGHIASLLKEIASALTVYNTDEVGILRLELFGATMEKCNSDLQSFISYLQLRQRKLKFLKKSLADEDLVAIFVNGLHPILAPLKMHMRLALPTKLEDATAIVLAHCGTPEVKAELLKLKAPGLSQHMFPVMATPQQQHSTTTTNRQPCHQFARGRCRYSNCRFSHTPVPVGTSMPASATTGQRQRSNNSVRCAFCLIPGHLASECRKRLAQLATLPGPQQQAAMVLHTPSAPSDTTAAETKAPDVFTFVFLITDKTINSWVLDSGATSSATFDERDCTEVRPCKIKVTAAGSEFTVNKIGTANITAIDEDGKERLIAITNCLISPLFPCKLLSLPALTKKGLTATMTENTIKLTNSQSTVTLLGVRDKASQLFLLREREPQHSATLLAKSYQAGDGSEADLLWKLHLRHGHRNFVDLARQYKLSIPKQLPSCTSCVMGKAHHQPKLGEGFERATRRAQGFHSDFRGPFSVPTPEGYNYLDNYRRLHASNIRLPREVPG